MKQKFKKLAAAGSALLMLFSIAPQAVFAEPVDTKPVAEAAAETADLDGDTANVESTVAEDTDDTDVSVTADTEIDEPDAETEEAAGTENNDPDPASEKSGDDVTGSETIADDADRGIMPIAQELQRDAVDITLTRTSINNHLEDIYGTGEIYDAPAKADYDAICQTTGRVSPGAEIGYEISVRNKTGYANYVVVTAELPDDIDSVSTTNGKVDRTNSSVSWETSVAAGGTTTLTFTLVLEEGYDDSLIQDKELQVYAKAEVPGSYTAYSNPDVLDLTYFVVYHPGIGKGGPARTETVTIPDEYENCEICAQCGFNFTLAGFTEEEKQAHFAAEVREGRTGAGTRTESVKKHSGITKEIHFNDGDPYIAMFCAKDGDDPNGGHAWDGTELVIDLNKEKTAGNAAVTKTESLGSAAFAGWAPTLAYDGVLIKCPIDFLYKAFTITRNKIIGAIWGEDKDGDGYADWENYAVSRITLTRRTIDNHLERIYSGSAKTGYDAVCQDTGRISPGADISYSITVDNISLKTPGKNVKVKLYTQGAAFSSVTPSDSGIYNKETGEITWIIQSIPASGSTTVSFEAAMADKVTQDVIRMYATAEAENGYTWYPADPNAIHTAFSNVEMLDLVYFVVYDPAGGIGENERTERVWIDEEWGVTAKCNECGLEFDKAGIRPEEGQWAEQWDSHYDECTGTGGSWLNNFTTKYRDGTVQDIHYSAGDPSIAMFRVRKDPDTGKTSSETTLTLDLTTDESALNAAVSPKPEWGNVTFAGWSAVKHEGVQSGTPSDLINGTLNLTGNTVIYAVWKRALYSDVPDTLWSAPAIYEATERNLMTGYANGTFGPSDPITRGQFATTIYRAAHQPAVSNPGHFPDVADGWYYSDPVAWASSKDVGIITGYSSDGLFHPDDLINREQLVTIMYRYAKYGGHDVSGTDEWKTYPDAGRVTEFAADAIGWAVSNGIIKGDSGNLNPQGNATREQCATILIRFLDLIGE